MSFFFKKFFQLAQKFTMRGQVCDVLFFGKSLIFLLRGIPKKSIEKKTEKHKIYQNIFHDLLVLETNIYV